MEMARRWTRRFEHDSDAWITLGGACRAAYRTRDALVAYERALQIDERADAAFAAGQLYRQQGDHSTAGARFARAYAAGAGPEALRENARALAAAGDQAAAAEAIQLWQRETGRGWTE
jgi:tetratricopeptide (TPR) repeat protein